MGKGKKWKATETQSKISQLASFSSLYLSNIAYPKNWKIWTVQRNRRFILM